MVSKALPTPSKNLKDGRLRTKLDYDVLLKAGKRMYPCSWLIINHLSNTSGSLRVGWTIPKFVGTAVLRNKFRRWCREFLKRHLTKSDLRLDANIVFRKKDKVFYKRLKYEEFSLQLQKAFKQLA